MSKPRSLIRQYLSEKRSFRIRGEAWRYFFQFLRHRLGSVLLIEAGSVVVASQSFLNLWLIHELFDRLMPAGDRMGILWLGVAFFLIRILLGFGGIFLGRAVTAFSSVSVNGMRQDLLKSLLARNRSYFEQMDLRLLHTRVVTETDRVMTALHTIITLFIPSLCVVIILSVIMAMIDMGLFAIVFIIFPVFFIIFKISGDHLYRRMLEHTRAGERWRTHLSFVLHYLDHIRMRTALQYEMVKHGQILSGLHDRMMSMSLSFGINRFVNSSLAAVLYMLMLVAGAWQVISGEMEVGQLLLFYVAGSMLLHNFDALVQGVTQLLDMNHALNAIHEIRRTGTEDRTWSSGLRVDFLGKVSLRDISFSYRDRPVLQGVDLEVMPGHCIVITGPNGAGKTTLINILLGLAAPHQGEVLIEGMDARQVDLQHFRSRVGYVPQKPMVLPGSIRMNLLYGREGITDADLDHAVDMASAKAFIRSLADGYETMVGEDGLRLSGGERQRLALAGALVHKPALLVLDEPTNHLDAEGIRTLISGLKALPGSTALVIVTHHWDMTGMADACYRLEGGRLVFIS